MPVLTQVAPVSVDIDVATTLGWYRHGRADPTTRLSVVGRGPLASGDFVRATVTPDGPGTVHVWWRGGHLDVESFGPGGTWMAERVPSMLGAHDPGVGVDTSAAWAPVVTAALHATRHVRVGASGGLYHELLPTIVEQRITGREARHQWAALCRQLGEPAPGPFTGVRLPPSPITLAQRPGWWFHPLGIERKRAQALVEVARQAGKLWAWADLPPTEAARRLRLIAGVGRWTVGSVLGPALGDPDAVAVGDFHLKNMVGYALAGEPRATDERMLELLAPYDGQRGRIVRALGLAGHAAPKFGPRQRIIAMHAW
jgi:endonuclease III